MGQISSPMPQPSQTTTARNAHKNIRFNQNMDEWSILTRLQDYEDQKKKEGEENLRKRKQREVTDMLTIQKQDMQRRAKEKDD